MLLLQSKRLHATRQLPFCMFGPLLSRSAVPFLASDAVSKWTSDTSFGGSNRNDIASPPAYILYSRRRGTLGNVRKMNDGATHGQAAHFIMRQKSGLSRTAKP